MAKAPIPGLTKTRLIPALGDEGAAKLQEALIQQTVATALAANVGPVSIWCAPNEGHHLFQDIASQHGVGLYEQTLGDLGKRMHAAFCIAAPALLIGVDCPPLTPAHLRMCADCLRRGDDAVFLPAEDGGYVLIGLRRPQVRLFEDIEWGGPTVMTATRDRLRELALVWSEPQTLWDLDRPEDLSRLAALIKIER
jgi:rSAM/selenodomain-associated transferase 1